MAKKMKTYDSFAAWYKDQNAGHKKIISKLRKLVSSTDSELIESSKWTNGVWLRGDSPVIYIHTEPDHVQFGFFAGARLSDPKKLLRGNGKHVRHIRIEAAGDIDGAAFTSMIRRAVRLTLGR